MLVVHSATIENLGNQDIVSWFGIPSEEPIKEKDISNKKWMCSVISRMR